MIEVRQTLVARAIRQAAAIQVPEPRPDTVKKLQERYKFLKVPESFEELFPNDPAQGIKFQNGTLTREIGGTSIVFELLHLLPNLILVQTRTSTDEAEEVLNDYIQRANKDRPDTIQVFGPPRYTSEIEFYWDKGLDLYAQHMANAGRLIDPLLEGYGSPVPRYRVAGITVTFDLSGFSLISPVHFNIERRVGLPDGLNIFYSHAPLKTKDHHALLSSLDRSVS